MRFTAAMELDPDAPSPFNPLAGHPLRSREDVVAALHACYTPLHACLPGPIDGTAAVYDSRAAALEAFARPLWGLAAAAAGGADRPEWWAPLANMLAAATDPADASFWGEPGDFDQRLVELPALAFALAAAPARLAAPGSAVADTIAAYLRHARGRHVFPNNWRLFPAMAEIGLAALGEQADVEAVAAAVRGVERFEAGAGWYRDGDVPQVDHYSGFAFHFYQLLIAALMPEAVDRDRIAARAAAFAAGFSRWFAEDGAALPFGRSLTYRFAAAAFFGACAFAGVEALPWGEMKRRYLQHLRWWRRWPIARRDGILGIGYGYPQALMAENYNGAASPYWAFKAFLPLALGPDHPFWAAAESAPERRQAAIIAAAGMIVADQPGHLVALSAGQSQPRIAHGAEKYAKFAYSTRYAFSVEGPLRRFDQGCFDSMIAFDDGAGWRVREASERVEIDGEMLVSSWRPWPDVEIVTRLWWHGPWQMRSHLIATPRLLRSIEGGFCIPWSDAQPPPGETGAGLARCETAADFTAILDLAGAGRHGRLHRPEPNTNLLHPRTIVPQLLGTIAPGTAMLRCAVLAAPDLAAAGAAWRDPPTP